MHRQIRLRTRKIRQRNVEHRRDIARKNDENILDSIVNQYRTNTQICFILSSNKTQIMNFTLNLFIYFHCTEDLGPDKRSFKVKD